MNIFVFGANWYNRGDESAVRAMLDEIKDRYPECNIKIHFNQNINDFEKLYPDMEVLHKAD